MLKFNDASGKEFPDHQPVTLGSSGKLVSGVGFTSSEQGGSQGIPFFKVSDMNLPENSTVMRVANNYVSDYQIKARRYKPIESDAIIFAKVGAAIFLERKRKAKNFLIDNNLMAFLPSFNIDFCKHLFDTIKLAEHVQVGALPSYNASTISLIPFNLPCAEEQQKIASFLNAIDTRIDQLTQKHALLVEYKKGVMQKIFSQEVRFKDANGCDFSPWESKAMGEVFTEKKTKIGSEDIQTHSITAGYGFVSQEEKFGKDISGKQNSSYILVEPLEFSYNKGSSKSYRYGCVYPNLTGKRIAVPNVFISFKPTNPISVDYWAHLFESGYLDKFLKTLIASGARMDGLLGISKADFFSIQVPTPSVEEQEKIGDFFRTIQEKVSASQKELETLKEYKQGLLQAMFV